MTPEDMEKLPKPIERIMTALEFDVMSEIVERLKEMSEITPVIDWYLNRLYAVGKSKTMIKRKLAEAMEKTEDEINYIYDTAAESDFARNKEIYEAAGRDYLPYAENKWLQQVVEAARRQTTDSLRPFENITQTTGFRVSAPGGKQQEFTPLSEYLEKSLDKAMLAIATGAKTYSEAVSDVIDEMTASGLRVVDYESGKSDRIEVAARRAVMTGVAQMTDQISEKNAEELGTDFWEVDWHMGARNTGTGYRNHQSWQGKVYSSEEMRTICGHGEMLGFAGINCYHIRFPFIPGINKRKYTDEWLEEQNRRENEKKTYHGRQYDTYGALQYQRRLERTIRKQKQEVELLNQSGADKDTVTAARARLRLTDKAYVEFSREMGLRQQLDRLKIASIDIPKERGISSKKGTSASSGKVDLEYIRSPKYRKKFEQITDNPEVNRSIYQRAKAMLTHRNGTNYEDMYLLDSASGHIVGMQTSSKTDYEVVYNDSLQDAIKKSDPYSLISIHNHPTNIPPSGSDFASAGFRKYRMGIIACHNGDVYVYQVGSKPFSGSLFDETVEKYRKRGYTNDVDASIKALEQFETDYGIKWRRL